MKSKIDRMQKIGFGGEKSSVETYREMKDKVLNSLKDHFKPEFLNRLDDIVVFDTLSKEAIAKIVGLQVELVKERLLQKEINLSVSPEVCTYLAEIGFDPQYGARPLKRIIQNKILTPVASLIISRGLLKGGSVSVKLGPDKEFKFDIKKGRKGTLIEDNSFANETLVSK